MNVMKLHLLKKVVMCKFLFLQDYIVTLSTIFYGIEEDNPEAFTRLMDMSNVDLNQVDMINNCLKKHYFLTFYYAICSLKTNKHGEGAVHVAAGLGQLDILKALASKGIPLGVTDYRGDNAVYWAARQGHEDVIQFLVSQGVSVNLQNKVRQLQVKIQGQ